jgi:hypothetical protein
MGFDEIISLAKANAAATIFVIGATVALIALAISLKGRKTGHHVAHSSLAEDEIRFRNFFWADDKRAPRGADLVLQAKT